MAWRSPSLLLMNWQRWASERLTAAARSPSLAITCSRFTKTRARCGGTQRGWTHLRSSQPFGRTLHLHGVLGLGVEGYLLHLVASDFDAPVRLEFCKPRADCSVDLRAVVDEFVENHGADLSAAVTEQAAIEARACVRRQHLGAHERLGGDDERVEGLVDRVARLVRVHHLHEEGALDVHNHVVLGECLLPRHRRSAFAQIAAMADFFDAGLIQVSAHMT